MIILPTTKRDQDREGNVEETIAQPTDKKAETCAVLGDEDAVANRIESHNQQDTTQEDPLELWETTHHDTHEYRGLSTGNRPRRVFPFTRTTSNACQHHSDWQQNPHPHRMIFSIRFKVFCVTNSRALQQYTPDHCCNCRAITKEHLWRPMPRTVSRRIEEAYYEKYRKPPIPMEISVGSPGDPIKHDATF